MAVWVLKTKNGRSMVEKEQQQSGGRASKKPKQKKIPQRGLGVAQLEKIRLEEQRQQQQQSKDSGSRFVGSLSQQQQSISFGSCQTHLGSQNSIFKPGDLVSDLDLLNPEPPSPINSQSGRSSMHRLGPMIWNLDPPFTSFRPPLSNDSDPVWPLPPDSVHNKQQLQHQQQQQRSFSMVNVSSLSSGVNLQMEPPSNQSYSSNFTPSCWPDEEKMVVMKRPWPFNVDYPPLPGHTFFHSKFPGFANPFRPSDESSSSGQYGIKFERNNTNFREASLSSPNTILFDPKVRFEPSPKKMITENGTLDARFLSLGSPPSSKSKSKHSISIPDFNSNKFVDFESYPFRGSREGMFFVSGETAEPRPYYNFLPTETKSHLTASNDRIGESTDSIDLNLKL